MNQENETRECEATSSSRPSLPKELEGYGNLWFSLYLSGLLTPLKDQPIKKNIDYGLRALENDLKKKRK